MFFVKIDLCKLSELLCMIFPQSSNLMSDNIRGKICMEWNREVQVHALETQIHLNLLHIPFEIITDGSRVGYIYCSMYIISTPLYVWRQHNTVMSSYYSPSWRSRNNLLFSRSTALNIKIHTIFLSQNKMSCTRRSIRKCNIIYASPDGWPRIEHNDTLQELKLIGPSVHCKTAPINQNCWSCVFSAWLVTIGIDYYQLN